MGSITRKRRWLDINAVNFVIFSVSCIIWLLGVITKDTYLMLIGIGVLVIHNTNV